jgi:hypothetical protein
MIGPVQLFMIGFRKSELPSEVRRQVDDLRANPAVRLLDVQIFRKERGQISRREVSGFTSEHTSGPGAFVNRMMTKAMSAKALSGAAPRGQGYLMRGDPIPDLKNDVPDNTNVLVLLLEHSWAMPLFNSVRESDAFPVTDAWMGRQSLAEAKIDIGE